MTVNVHRGEVEWTVAGHTFMLRLSLNDIAILEAAENGMIMDMVERFRGNHYGLKDVVAVLGRALRTGVGRSYKVDEVRDLIEEFGFIPAAGVAVELLIKALTREDEEEAKPSDPL